MQQSKAAHPSVLLRGGWQPCREASVLFSVAELFILCTNHNLLADVCGDKDKQNANIYKQNAIFFCVK
jgi:hypothetical protein